jgi:hypothetical protein
VSLKKTPKSQITDILCQKPHLVVIRTDTALSGWRTVNSL